VAPYVQTVRGRVPADEIGFTLPHEHTFVELWHLESRHDYLGQIDDPALLASELRRFAEVGGSCLVDLTLAGMGRRPAAVRELSEDTGVHIVVGAGWYRQPYYPPEAAVDRRSVESLAEEIVHECAEGIGGTGIRPGIIGEIGADKSWVSAQEERVHRAAARAQVATGLALTTHSQKSRVGLAQLQILLAEGADPGRIVIGHCDSYPVLEYHLELLAAGTCVEFDLFGVPGQMEREREGLVLRLLLELLERGYERQLLLSQDVASVEQLKSFGGGGYCYLQEVVIPELLARGVPQGTIDVLTIENPRRILSCEGFEPH
jgi:predicted metal-dependent phosphotriesterase family hydrolase